MIVPAPSKDELTRRAARALDDASVVLLVTGESGVGKEHEIRRIVGRSSRSGLPLIVVDVSALPHDLIEAELFGYEAGAFTGAHRARPGAFEVAGRGVVLLDEVGELPAELQVKLLGVLGRRQVHRMGSWSPRPIECAIVAATHRDLREMVAQGTYRRDLYYRLRGVRIEIAPLRDRMNELPQIVNEILRRLPAEQGRAVRLSRAAWEALSRHSWPGNVRELEQALTSAAALYPEVEELEPAHLDLDPVPAPARAGRLDVRRLTPIFPAGTVRDALVAEDGDCARAAARLGVSRATLYRWLKQWAQGTGSLVPADAGRFASSRTLATPPNHSWSGSPRDSVNGTSTPAARDRVGATGRQDVGREDG